MQIARGTKKSDLHSLSNLLNHFCDLSKLIRSLYRGRRFTLIGTVTCGATIVSPVKRDYRNVENRCIFRSGRQR
jgi:hypothetical protein